MLISFIKTIYFSLFPQPKVYKRLLKRPIPFALGYFLILLIILNTIFSLVFLKNSFTSKINYFTLKSKIFENLKNFPKDLTISLNDGNLSTSYNRPYFFAYPFLVVDEFATDKQILEYQSTVVLSKNSINIPRANGIRKFIYPRVSMQLTNDKVRSAMPLLKLLYGLFPFVVIAYLFFFQVFIMIIKTLLILVVISYLSHLLLKKTRHHISFDSILHLGLYSTTLPMLCYYGVKICGLGFKTMYWYPFLITIFLAAAIYEVYIYKEKPGQSGWSLI
jgi:hypothetical protein